MPISTQEQADLNKMKADQVGIYELHASMVRDILRSTPEQLRHMGQYTIEGALKSSCEHLIKDLDKLMKEHIKKYPD